MTGDSGPPAFVSLAQRIARERAEAKDTLERLDDIGAFLEREIPPRWRTLGFVMEADAKAARILEENPRESRALAQFALAALTMIPRDVYPHGIRRPVEATAWKELANAHRYQSDYDAAHRALDAGERCVAESLTSAYDRATLDLARALVYCDEGRLEDADRFLAKSAKVFEEHRDSRQVSKCWLLHGMSEHRKGRLREASASYEKAIQAVRQTDDLATLASALNNLGHARTDLGQYAPAVEALQEALSLFTEMRMTSEATRTRGVLGKVLLHQGKFEQARDFFVVARSEFLRVDMPEEAAIVGLLLIEAMIGLGERSRVRSLIDEVEVEFESAHLGDRARPAIRYLRAAVETSRGREATRHVRQYVQRLREEPQGVFVPPPRD